MITRANEDGGKDKVSALYCGFKEMRTIDVRDWHDAAYKCYEVLKRVGSGGMADVYMAIIN